MNYYIHFKRCFGCWATEYVGTDYNEAVEEAEYKVAEGCDEVYVRYFDPFMGEVDERVDEY